ncbi:MAG: LysM peptidoglycan-binding domain-containing protein [Thermodesulfobacteriota bacterium]
MTHPLLRWSLIICLVFASACAKKYQAESQDMKPNLEPELVNPDFLKIKRPRPLTKQEKEALASKTDIPFNLDVRETEEVQQFLTYFTQERRETMERWLERAAPHLPYIRAVLATHKLPPDIIALPFIESGYNTMAYSPAGAGGMWQFMPATGRRFGLNIDWWEDERRNPYLSTVAAAKYLGELHAMFNDWNLALAAYNCGEGKMSRVINQSGHNDFFDIAKNPNLLKQETRHYVPKFLAVLKIFKNLEALGFKPVNWGAGQVLEEVQVGGGTDLASMAEACGMSWEEFHKYNSGFRRQVSPPDRQSAVYVPVTKKQLALAYLENPSGVANRGIKAYTAAAGDSWWNISRRSGVPIAALRQMNPSVGEAVGPGQTVYVPLDSSAQDTALADLDDKPSSRSPVVLAKAQSHKVKRGESLAAISKRYGVSQSDILKANNIKSAKYLVAGTSLSIPGKPVLACPPEQPKVQYASAQTVEVKKGLTLSAISAATKVDVDDIMKANGLKSPRDLRAGMKLKIPGGSAPAPTPAEVAVAKPPKEAPAKNQAEAQKLAQVASRTSSKDAIEQAKAKPEPTQTAQTKDKTKPSAPIHYSVTNGDTVWSIARKFKVDPIALLSWNNLDRSSHLKPGDKIKINQ